MKAEPLLFERHQVAENAFVEVKVHICVLRYDNEAGKGDHRHWGDRETPYAFTTPAQLLADFWADVDQWRP